MRNVALVFLCAISSGLAQVQPQRALVAVERGEVPRQALALGALGADGIALLSAFLVEAGASKVLAQAIAIVLVTPVNFIGNKLWSFGPRG